MRRPRRRDPHRPRHGLEVLPAQQTHHYLTLAPGREPTPTAAPGGHAGRHRFLNVLPHLDTPPASTLSQSSVQENPRAQDDEKRGACPKPPGVLWTKGLTPLPNRFIGHCDPPLREEILGIAET